MKTRYTVALSMIAGALLGATAIQGLHAQVKKVYFISESEVVNQAELSAWNAAIGKAIRDQGGSLIVSENITQVLGTPPKRIGITEWPTIEKAKAWLTEREKYKAQRDKAIKFTRQYIVEGQ